MKTGTSSLVGRFIGDKPSLKGALSGSREQICNFTPHEIPSERLKLQTSNFVHGLATGSTNLLVTNPPLSGRGQGHVTNFRISHVMKISSERLKLASSNFVCLQAISIVSLGTTDRPLSILEFYTP